MAGQLNLDQSIFLVADSSNFYREMLRRILWGFGAKDVLDAADATTAKSILATRDVDIFICDAELEGMNGFDLVRSIRALKEHPRRSIPMLISTGSTTVGDVNRARNAGAHMVIMKPVSPAAIYDRLVWIAQTERPFWESDSYYGPDRRVKARDDFSGEDRRAATTAEEQIDEAFRVNRDEHA